MRPKFFVVLLLIAVSSLFAQTKTGNQYVTGIVESNTGWITIRIAPGNPNGPILSYPNKSFLSVMVGDKIFTNNNVGTNIQNDPRFGGNLDNGVTGKVADTIITTWANKNGCDIIQEVYPVKLGMSGQIVMRWKVRNNGTKLVTSAVQFLLDIQVGDQSPNDGAPVLTRYGYRPIWEKYTSGSQFGIPWFYAAFENGLPNPPTFNTGITGVGYTQDVNYKLGLKKPTQMTVGDWGNLMGQYALVDFLWGVAGSAPWGTNYGDAAIHFQWDGVGVGGGKTSEIARTSYGTGEFGICTGQLFGIVFYPRLFEWNKTTYEPDTATVEFYAFNTFSPMPTDLNYGPASSNTYLKIHTGPNLRIVWPDTATNATKTSQRQRTDPNGYIPQYGVGSARWKVVADKVITPNDLNSWLKFTAESSLSDTGSIFFNSGDGDTCEHAVLIDYIVQDTAKPIVENIDVSQPYSLSFDTRDNRPNDLGLKSITFSTDDVRKFTVGTSPQINPCSQLVHRVKVLQLDSTVAGCVQVNITDCADNTLISLYCFNAHPFTLIPDTLPPVISTVQSFPGDTIPCRNLCDSIAITEQRPFDRGLATIEVLEGGNMKMSPVIFADSARWAAAMVCVIDSTKDGWLRIRVRDVVTNETERRFCYTAFGAGVEEEHSANDVELIGNPASERTILRVSLSKSQTVVVRLIDISGREVAVWNEMLFVGTNDIAIATATLIPGTYYIVAEFGGRQYAKKLQVVKELNRR